MLDPFIQFGLVILVVLGVSVIMRLLKQPLIIGYIISGIIVGPFLLNVIPSGDIVGIFSKLGIAFLLFMVGLHLSPKVIRDVGKISLVTGIGQIIFTSVIGFFLSRLLGFEILTSIYIAVALTFSSTIIIMKLLSDKDALERLYGKISIGFLLVQDLVAILILIALSPIAEGVVSGTFLLRPLILGLATIGLLIPIGYYLLPKLSSFLAKSQELLFVFAISWGLGLSLLFLYIGLSVEVGALIAGIMLSMSPYSFEISSKLKPLRDFFIIYFFIFLGSQMTFGNIGSLIGPAIILSLFILIGNPLIVMIIMGTLRYSRKTGFMAGLTVAQISEFSLILVAMGVTMGHLSSEILSFVTLVGLITIAGSTYLIMYSEKIFKKIKHPLRIFERKKIKEKEIPDKKYKYILFGYNRIGFSVIKAFAKKRKNFLVVDYNPEVVEELKKEKIDAVYGDVDDSEFLEDLEMDQCSLIVSTIPEKEVNKLILEVIKREKLKPITILTGRQIKDALELYEKGADYVILPHFLGGEYVSKLIQSSNDDRKVYRKEKRRELKNLKERLLRGQKHPRIEKEPRFK